MSSLRDFHAEQAEKPLLDHPLTETVSQLISIAQRELQTLRNIGKGQPNLEQQRRSYADAHYAVSSMESRLFADIIEIGIPLDPAEKQRYEQLNALKSLITCAGLPSYSAIANTHGATLENEEEGKGVSNLPVINLTMNSPSRDSPSRASAARDSAS